MSASDDMGDRVDRALEPMRIDELAPGIFEVQGLGGDTYHVDPSLGACQCPDFEYNVGDRDGVVCKHVAAVVARRGPDVLEADR